MARVGGVHGQHRVAQGQRLLGVGHVLRQACVLLRGEVLAGGGRGDGVDRENGGPRRVPGVRSPPGHAGLGDGAG